MLKTIRQRLLKPRVPLLNISEVQVVSSRDSALWSQFRNHAFISLLILLLLAPVFEVRLSASFLIFFGSIFGGLLGLTRFKTLTLITAWLIAILYLLIVISPLVKLTAPYFIVSDPLPEKADAIVSLSAEWPLNNLIKSQGLERLIHASRLVQSGVAPYLVVTDLPWFRGSVQKDRSLLLADMANVTISIGPVENTFDEALALKKLSQEKNWTQIILVTSPLHSKRAKAIFMEQIPGLKIVSSPAEAREFDLEILVSSYERLKVARLMCYEVAAWGKNLILGRL